MIERKEKTKREKQNGKEPIINIPDAKIYSVNKSTENKKPEIT